MNQRIRELAEQATKHYPATESSGEFSTFDIAKFAELIVRECGILADQYNFEKNRGTINPFKTTAYEFIKQHFGVE